MNRPPDLNETPTGRKSRAYPIPDLSLEASIFCIWHDMEMHELVAAARRPDLARLRQKFYYIMAELPTSQEWLKSLDNTNLKDRPSLYPWEVIGRALGRDHTTILQGSRAYAARNKLALRGKPVVRTFWHSSFRPAWWDEEKVTAS